MYALSDLAWAAGLFEGEGCLSLQSQTAKKRWNTHQAVARLTMTDRDVVLRFQRIVGFGRVNRIKRGRWFKSHWKTQWQWAACGFEEFQALVAMFWQWLGKRRREKATDLLVFMSAYFETRSDRWKKRYRRFGR